jgi:7,8-dihydropterin-6-yl-methyl-4-(beta-D-ribofuranosyl)aminobenzene 5'-phosphate synthase
LQELQALNPDVIVPMHCTGERFIDMLRQQMPDRVVYSNVGSRYTFGLQ